MSIFQSIIGTTTQKLKLDATNMVDMVVSDLSDPAGVSAPNYTTIIRGGFTFSTACFAGNLATKEYRTYRVELGHNTDPTKVYEVHFRGTPSTDLTGDVKMFIEYALQKKAGDIIAGTTVEAIKSILSNSNTNGTEYYFSFPLSPLSTGLATMAKGDSLIINICRLASDVADTYAGSICFTEFGVHGYIDSTGEQFGD